MAYTDIDKSDDYFNTVLYTGTGTTNNITVGFKPDFTWIKRRNSDRDHCLFNIISGTNNVLSSNLTSEEEGTGAGGWTATSTGFDVGVFNKTNSSGDTYASWNWLASNTTVSNTDGSITSTVSADTTSGFSIATYTGNGVSGANFGHGLSGIPDLLIIKNRDQADNWTVIPGNANILGGSYYLEFTTGAKVGNSDVYTSYPGVSINYLSTNHRVNANGEDYVCYSFRSIKGFSKIGNYTGNNSSDGPFIYTGFKPAWLMVKRSDAPEYWNILDTARADVPNANPTDQALYANDSSAEYSETQGIDLVSNGFKVREGGAGWCNASGATYIYMAFAESPLVTSTGIPTTAR